jgi:hypothetical protein
MARSNRRYTCLYTLALITVMAFSYGMEKQIEINQNMVEIDYN